MPHAGHVLIIDDDPFSGHVLGPLLTREGLSFTALTDPRDFERVAGSLPPCRAIFLDLEMPGLTGYDMLPILRKMVGPGVPIIAYTVHTNEANNALRQQFDAFLPKPLDAEEFPRNLARILAGERVWITR